MPLAWQCQEKKIQDCLYPGIFQQDRFTLGFYQLLSFSLLKQYFLIIFYLWPSSNLVALLQLYLSYEMSPQSQSCGPHLCYFYQWSFWNPTGPILEKHVIVTLKFLPTNKTQLFLEVFTEILARNSFQCLEKGSDHSFY